LKGILLKQIIKLQITLKKKKVKLTTLDSIVEEYYKNKILDPRALHIDLRKKGFAFNKVIHNGIMIALEELIHFNNIDIEGLNNIDNKYSK
jgi:hypothetical protein